MICPLFSGENNDSDNHHISYLLSFENGLIKSRQTFSRCSRGGGGSVHAARFSAYGVQTPFLRRYGPNPGSGLITARPSLHIILIGFRTRTTDFFWATESHHACTDFQWKSVESQGTVLAPMTAPPADATGLSIRGTAPSVSVCFSIQQ